jgi:hypothetical protein
VIENKFTNPADGFEGEVSSYEEENTGVLTTQKMHIGVDLTESLE